MTLILLQAMIQSIASTLHWVGLFTGIRALPGDPGHRRRWAIGSAIVFVVWLGTIMLLAGNGFFRFDVWPRGVPIALAATLAAGYLLLLSPTFREIITGVPQHWLIAIQTFRILGGVFLVRYFQGELPALFAIPAGVGDVLTGLFAPLVAYWWFVGKPYARGAAIAWNLFGMADLINAVVIGTLTGGGGGGIVFPIVLIPIYAVPRAFLIHSYSLVGLLGKTSRRPATAQSLDGAAPATP
jgi:hypothetical protein